MSDYLLQENNRAIYEKACCLFWEKGIIPAAELLGAISDKYSIAGWRKNTVPWSHYVLTHKDKSELYYLNGKEVGINAMIDMPEKQDCDGIQIWIETLDEEQIEALFTAGVNKA